MIKYTAYLLVIGCFVAMSCARSQPETNPGRQLVGTCEGCEAIFEYGDKKLSPVDTLSDFHDDGTQIRLTGFIYGPDARTPAKDVILYIYHTDQAGIYPPSPDATGWARRHGSIRGWIKTNVEGRYNFYTLKPGTYPDRSQPAHIHPVILEPDGSYYWIDEYYFAGDTLLTGKEASPVNPRGGTPGLVVHREKGGILTAHRDIILGRNVPGYK